MVSVRKRVERIVHKTSVFLELHEQRQAEKDFWRLVLAIPGSGDEVEAARAEDRRRVCLPALERYLRFLELRQKEYENVKLTPQDLCSPCPSDRLINLVRAEIARRAA